MTPEEVPDTVTIEVRPGATVLITSDLHFAAERTQSSAWAEEEISQALEQVQGPGVYVMAGDVFELWAGDDPTTEGAMASHPRVEAAGKDFASGPDRHVGWLPRHHDRSLGWGTTAAAGPQRLG